MSDDEKDKPPAKRSFSMVALFMIGVLALAGGLLGTHLADIWAGGEGLDVVKGEGIWFAFLNTIGIGVGIGQNQRNQEQRK